MCARQAFVSTIVALVIALLAVPVEARTFRVALERDVASMDPHVRAEGHSRGFHHNIYEPLVRYSAALEFEPALATRWQLINPVTWRFELRRDVRFHNGNKFDADDVVFSFARVRGEGSDFAAFVESIQQIHKVDSHTVELITRSPDPTLLSGLARWYIMDREWARANGAELPAPPDGPRRNHALLHANGTGPFVLDERRPGVRTILEPNPNWWDQPRHNLNRVIITPIESNASRTKALLSGKLSLTLPLALPDIARIDEADGLRVLQGPDVRTIFLGMDQFRDHLLYSDVEEANPFKDLRVRRALYRAIDIEAIQREVMGGASTPTGLLVGPGVTGFNEQMNRRPPYSPEAARALLAEAGYPEGFSVTLDCPSDRYVKDSEICQVVAEMLAKVGIRVTPLAQSTTKFFKKLMNGDVSFYLLGWTPGDLDAGSVIRDLLVPPHEGGLDWNAGRFGDPRISRLSHRIAAEVNPTKRQAMIDQCFRIMQEQVGYIPLHQQALAWGVREGVDLAQRPDNALHYWTVKME